MKPQKLAYLCFVLAFLVMLHQAVMYNDWWTWSQFLHHESWAFGLVCLGVGIFLGIHKKV
jgi:hypothetical protein